MSKHLCVSRLIPREGANSFSGAQVFLNNGERLEADVLELAHDGTAWHVLMDVAVRFGISSGNSAMHHIMELLTPDSGMLQGSKLLLSNNCYLSLLHEISFKNGKCRVKVRMSRNETTNTQAETASAENTKAE